MILEVIPNALFSMPNLKPVFIKGASSVLYKTLREDHLKKEKYLTSALIIYVVKGRQLITDSRGVETEIKENHILFLPKDLYVVSDFITDDGTFEAWLFFYDDDLIQKYIVHCDNSIRHSHSQPPDSLYVIPANQQLHNFMSSLASVYGNHQQDDGRQLLEIKLLELLHLLGAHDKAHYFFNALVDFNRLQYKRSIHDIMESHFDRNLKIEDYAQLTGRSTSTFIRDFKKLYQETPYQWLITKRMDKANEILSTPGASVKEAASEVGYENVSHFIKAYKKHFGMTPKQATKVLL